MSIQAGTPAPQFALPDQHGGTVALADFAGSKNVLLVFYPWSFTRTCTSELSQISAVLPDLQNDVTQVLAVSCDAMFTQRVFAEQQALRYQVLSDFWPHGAVASAYGVFDERIGAAVRGSFVIDRSGLLRWSVVNPVGEARDLAEAQAALESLG